MKVSNITSTIGVTLTKLRRSGLWESNLGDAITDSMVTAGLNVMKLFCCVTDASEK
jgi:hypothetical protein